MSLDFAVLGENGTPEKTVSLGVDLHHELVTVAVARKLTCFQGFEDYYEDAEVAANDLPSLVKQIQALYAQTDSTELQYFLNDLVGLIDYAIAKGRHLHAIAD
jgi:hypothetical protein